MKNLSSSLPVREVILDDGKTVPCAYEPKTDQSKAFEYHSFSYEEQIPVAPEDGKNHILVIGFTKLTNLLVGGGNVFGTISESLNVDFKRLGYCELVHNVSFEQESADDPLRLYVHDIDKVVQFHATQFITPKPNLKLVK